MMLAVSAPSQLEPSSKQQGWVMHTVSAPSQLKHGSKQQGWEMHTGSLLSLEMLVSF